MIYPQYITGKYRRLKDVSSIGLLLLYFLSSWIRWDRGEGVPSQAILMDLPNRRAYLFGVEIWPDELYYLAGVLIVAAFSLFVITSLFGRVWCGYTCPHTVFVDLFVKVERWIQGDRNARMKLDKSPMNSDKLFKKLLTHTIWIFLSFGFAFAWVCYFYNAPSLLEDVANFQVSPGGLSWLLGLTASTYFFAGFIREKVCLYMCPYGRFQSAMLDNNSSIVTYHDWRGEPRGKYDPNSPSIGDCIDCKKCVVVCPMGIDIRNGLQLACIGCGLCVDACNSVMESLKRPLYLIGYDSVRSTNDKIKGLVHSNRAMFIKIIIFTTLLLIFSSGLTYSLLTKEPIKITILQDRNSFFTRLPDGSIRNNYELKIHNKTYSHKKLSISADPSVPAIIKFQGLSEYQDVQYVDLMPEEEIDTLLFVKIEEMYIKDKELIIINITDIDNNKSYRVEANFMSKRTW